ncbi:hypothetical protein EHQ23_02315 [Leptospira bourretii]|uniref:Uncharacterized protein n=1 Tax=Leptospira bourretii TaxID=2484962 RepID=A0A4R9IMH1_9LEPT|nr:hypothetical protein [Leptospira bourretii]TGK89970.1 hypothetical protein EHQ23_02315 [Leptospira bourretii]TGK92193.1 hypothetical protein EHQ26_09460 [Leptospira bourretii]TGL36218.1 hypothetical protein EHQ45_07290 [Leptospira bourretii]
MKHESTEEYNLTITESDIDFENWTTKNFISPQLKSRLIEAQILIVPTEGFREYNGPVFPVKTEEIFHFIKSNIDNEQIVDICIEDSEYRELALHSNLIVLGEFLVKTVALSIFLGVFSNYIYDNYVKKGTADSTIRLAITVEKEKKKSVRVEYEGRASDFNQVSDRIKEIIREGKK